MEQPRQHLLTSPVTQRYLSILASTQPPAIYPEEVEGPSSTGSLAGRNGGGANTRFIGFDTSCGRLVCEGTWRVGRRVCKELDRVRA